VEILISEAAASHIARHGGAVFVRPQAHRCCTGGLTLLDASTSSPPDAAAFDSIRAHGIDVRFASGPGGRPDQLHIELRGRRRPHPVALWDGCAYKP
jgi:hypothetical protein